MLVLMFSLSLLHTIYSHVDQREYIVCKRDERVYIGGS